LRDLVNDVTDLPTLLGPELLGEEPYTPVAIAVLSGEPSAPKIPRRNDPNQPDRVWPGPTLPGEPIGTQRGFACLLVTGSDVAAVRSAAEPAPDTTWWTFGGQRWRIDFRPLLPDETSCADLI
jgi:hypothetical protein